MNELRFDQKVAIVTGAGSGLGRAYAILLASRGAKVVVNDLGGDPRGVGNSSRPADIVVQEIQQAGGVAVSDYNSVVDGEEVVRTALENFGRIDILINNAGILRDKSFARISKDDFDAVFDVHLKGTFLLTQAAFPIFKKQGYGRIVMTSSNSGLYGNFGQANYSSAKMGVVGLSNTVAIEGAKYNVHCNVIVPFAASRLTQGIFPPEILKEIKPELIAPVVVYLCHDTCTDNGIIIDSSLGWAGKTYLVRGTGALLRKTVNEKVTIEDVRDKWNNIVDMENAQHYSQSDFGNHHSNIIKQLKGESEPNIASNIEYKFTKENAILYALAVGGTVSHPEKKRYVFEGHKNFSIIPSFYILPPVMAIFQSGLVKNAIKGKEISYSNLLHGEQYLEIVGKVPPEGKLYSTVKLSEVLDKGSAGVLVIDVETFNPQHQLVYRTQTVIFALNCGNFGGPRNGTKTMPPVAKPNRIPDRSVRFTTTVDQAAFYRLTGDQNPVHIDENVSKLFGFAEPILHGLCTLGISVRTIIEEFAYFDADLFKCVKARFSKPVIPGQTLRIDMWQNGNRIHFETVVVENNAVAITGAYVDLKDVMKHSTAKL